MGEVGGEGDSGDDGESETRAILAGGGASGEAALDGMMVMVGLVAVFLTSTGATGKTTAGENADGTLLSGLALGCIFSKCWVRDFFTRKTFAQK